MNNLIKIVSLFFTIIIMFYLFRLVVDLGTNNEVGDGGFKELKGRESYFLESQFPALYPILMFLSIGLVGFLIYLLIKKLLSKLLIR